MDRASISKQDQKLSHKYATDIPNEIVEEQTKKVPNLLFLGFAGISILASAVLTFGTRKRVLGNFVGLWVPTVLLLGLYNKVVKVEDEILENVVTH
jgi:hypothetical protein